MKRMNECIPFLFLAFILSFFSMAANASVADFAQELIERRSDLFSFEEDETYTLKHCVEGQVSYIFPEGHGNTVGITESACDYYSYGRSVANNSPVGQFVSKGINYGICWCKKWQDITVIKAEAYQQKVAQIVENDQKLIEQMHLFDQEVKKEIIEKAVRAIVSDPTLREEIKKDAQKK